MLPNVFGQKLFRNVMFLSTSIVMISLLIVSTKVENYYHYTFAGNADWQWPTFHVITTLIFVAVEGLLFYFGTRERNLAKKILYNLLLLGLGVSLLTTVMHAPLHHVYHVWWALILSLASLVLLASRFGSVIYTRLKKEG